jgi:hypothetical protein
MSPKLGLVGDDPIGVCPVVFLINPSGKVNAADENNVVAGEDDAEGIDAKAEGYGRCLLRLDDDFCCCWL